MVPQNMYILLERFKRGVSRYPEVNQMVIKWLEDYIKANGGEVR